MIAVGEESGNLPDLLDEVADFYDGEIEYDLNRLTESIEPILDYFIAVLVLILALGVFLPIWDLGAAADIIVVRFYAFALASLLGDPIFLGKQRNKEK